jgi:hypothetical protein
VSVVADREVIHDGLAMVEAEADAAPAGAVVHVRNSLCMSLAIPGATHAQSLQTVNMAVPSKSFQMVIYPVAQQKGYM